MSFFWTSRTWKARRAQVKHSTARTTQTQVIIQCTAMERALQQTAVKILVGIFPAPTSPNAPLPITFKDSKSSRPSLVLFKRRNSVSFCACADLLILFYSPGRRKHSSAVTPNTDGRCYQIHLTLKRNFPSLITSSSFKPSSSIICSSFFCLKER